LRTPLKKSPPSTKKKSAPSSSPNGYRHFFFLVVLAEFFSARFGSFAKPTDQKQDSGYRLARTIIRAEPPDPSVHCFTFSPYAYTLMWGLCPTHPRPKPLPKSKGIAKTLTKEKSHVLNGGREHSKEMDEGVRLSPSLLSIL